MTNRQFKCAKITAKSWVRKVNINIDFKLQKVARETNLKSNRKIREDKKQITSIRARDKVLKSKIKK